MTAIASIIGRGVTGSRPANGIPGQLYFDMTLSEMLRDNGSTWDVVEGAGGPAELGYVQATSNFTGAGSGTDVAVTSMTLTVTVGSRPIMVTYSCAYIQRGSVTGPIILKLHDDTASAFVMLQQFDLGATNGLPAVLPARLNPAAGSRAYTIYAQYTGGGTAPTLFAGATDPMWLQVREV